MSYPTDPLIFGSDSDHRIWFRFRNWILIRILIWKRIRIQNRIRNPNPNLEPDAIPNPDLNSSLDHWRKKFIEPTWNLQLLTPTKRDGAEISNILQKIHLPSPPSYWKLVRCSQNIVSQSSDNAKRIAPRRCPALLSCHQKQSLPSSSWVTVLSSFRCRIHSLSLALSYCRFFDWRRRSNLLPSCSLFFAVFPGCCFIHHGSLSRSHCHLHFTIVWSLRNIDYELYYLLAFFSFPSSRSVTSPHIVLEVFLTAIWIILSSPLWAI